MSITSESRTESGYTILEVLVTLFICAFVFLVFHLVIGSTPHRMIEEDNCPPVSTSTGRLLCYSDGTLVYQTPTYRNGGYLCTPSGVEINISGGQTDSLCIEESTQASQWSPPPPGKR